VIVVIVAWLRDYDHSEPRYHHSHGDWGNRVVVDTIDSIVYSYERYMVVVVVVVRVDDHYYYYYSDDENTNLNWYRESY
jgi:hypothetical protein